MAHFRIVIAKSFGVFIFYIFYRLRYEVRVTSCKEASNHDPSLGPVVRPVYC
jgi:hypothetical protein